MEKENAQCTFPTVFNVQFYIPIRARCMTAALHNETFTVCHCKCFITEWRKSDSEMRCAVLPHSRLWVGASWDETWSISKYKTTTYEHACYWTAHVKTSASATWPFADEKYIHDVVCWQRLYIANADEGHINCLVRHRDWEGQENERRPSHSTLRLRVLNLW